MKFIGTLAVALLAAAPAFAVPQASGTTKDAATTTSVSMTAAQTCLASCDASDVTCQAACLGTAHPNASQVNQTTECAANCDQGDGSSEATEKYSNCVQACISSYFPTSQTVVANAGTASGAATNAASATGSGAATHASATGTGASKTTGSSESSSATGTGAASSSTGAASNLVASSAFGLAGIFAVVLAL